MTYSNYLKCLFRTKLLGERCSTCFKPYSEKDSGIYFQVGISDKEKFSVFDKLKGKKTIESSNRYIGATKDWWAPSVARKVHSLKKKRDYIAVACVELNCTNCCVSKEIEISCADLELLS